MPVRVAVTLQVENPSVVLPQDLHSHVSGWLDTDHHEGDKPWALGRVGFVGTTWRLDVCLLDDALLPRLAERLTAVGDRPLRLGKHPRRTTDAYVDRLMPPEVVAERSWESWVGGAMPCRSWVVTTHSPLLIRRGNVDMVLPNPLGWVKGLHRRFVLWCPPARNPFGRSEPRFPLLVVRRFRGESVDVPQSEGVHVGFMGEVELLALKADSRHAGAATEEQRREVDLLMGFAEFAGMGSMTPRGFGAVEVSRG